MGVTIRDVAAAAGTSVSTVSKVINGHYSISEETAERVRAVIRQLGYYPSASAQSFARGTTNTVAVLADLHENIAFQNPHLFEIIAGMEEKLRQRGYSLTVVGTDTTAAYGAAEDMISRRSVDAIAIHVSVMSHPLSALLTKKRYPHIVLGLPSFDSQVCWIDNNNVSSGVTAVSHLLEQGYERIAFIGGQEHDLISAHRLQGVRQGLEGAGVHLNDQYIWQGESTRQEGYRMTRKLLDADPRPDAIICANNYIALGCVAAVQEAKLKIPRNIGILTFDNYPFSQMVEPSLTVVDIKVRDMGVQAAKLLVDMIHNPNLQIQTYATTSELIVRQSTKRKA